MSVDTSRTIAFFMAPWKLVGLIALSLGMLALSAAVAGLVPGVELGPGDAVFGYAGLALFGAATALLVWRLVTQRGPVVTLTPEGLRDTRVAADLIPWRAVHAISTWERSRQKFMVVAVDPAVERTLRLTRLARWTRDANRALGADGLCIAAQGLATDHETLVAAAQAYARAAHGIAPPAANRAAAS